ncbi:MAG: hypothetical protein KDA20_03265 [Phycisphaerales bacterium]|nr:hypothetical protein [Phycisphaerales bacterium]
MSLSDVVSSLNLGVWAIAAMLIFLVVFIAIACRIFWRYPRSTAGRAARLVFEEGQESTHGGAA